MEFNLTFFEEVRVSARLYNNGTIYLLDGERNMITSGDTFSSRYHFVLTPAERANYEKAWAAQDPDSIQEVLYYLARGEHYISCYSKMNHMDWLIISSINFDAFVETKQGIWIL